MVDDELVADAVELVGRDAGADRSLNGIQRLRGDPAGDPHRLDGLVVAYVRTAIGERCDLSDVLRTIDGGGHRALGGQAAGSQDSHPQSLENGCERRRSVA